MPRVLLQIMIVAAIFGGSGWWYIRTGTLKDAMEKEIAATQSQVINCAVPLQLQVKSVTRSGFPWSLRVALHDVELTLIRDNGQSLTYRTDVLAIEGRSADLALNSGPLKGLGGEVKGANGVQVAPAWRLVAPSNFTVEESGTHAKYDVRLKGGGIAALVLAQGAPGVSEHSRPVRVRFPAELALQTKRLDANGEKLTHGATGTRSFQFPSVASGWLTHSICDNGRAQALFGLVQSINNAVIAK